MEPLDQEHHSGERFDEKQKYVAKFKDIDPVAGLNEHKQILTKIAEIYNLPIISPADEKWKENKISELYSRKRSLEVALNL